MTTAKPPRRVRYVARIDQVLEVSLRGTSDLSFWRGRLKHEGLTPVEEDGRAQLLVSATAAKYNGIRFRELCFLVAVTAQVAGDTVQGYYLMHAFNSVRLYAWIERTFFSCPYWPAEVAVAAQPQVSIAMREKGQDCFRATLATDIAATRVDADGWQGPIFLPTGHRQQFFHAQLSGKTEVYPSRPNDTFHIAPHPRWAIFAAIKEAGLIGQEWHIRRNAVHAKSQTLDRDRCTAELLASEREAGYFVK